jgi:hypothetical protein
MPRSIKVWTDSEYVRNSSYSRSSGMVLERAGYDRVLIGSGLKTRADAFSGAGTGGLTP